MVSWLNESVTQAVHREIAVRIKDELLYLGNGGYLASENPQQTALNYAKSVGYIAGLRAAMNIEFEEQEVVENA